MWVCVHIKKVVCELHRVRNIITITTATTYQPIQLCMGVGSLRERGIYTRPITTTTHLLLRKVGLFMFYEKAISLSGNSCLLVHLIYCSGHAR